MSANGAQNTDDAAQKDIDNAVKQTDAQRQKYLYMCKKKKADPHTTPIPPGLQNAQDAGTAEKNWKQNLDDALQKLSDAENALANAEKQVEDQALKNLPNVWNAIYNADPSRNK
jgi:hypothetical protein